MKNSNNPHVREARALLDRAKAEDRDLTAAERGKALELLAKGELERVRTPDELIRGGGGNTVDFNPSGRPAPASWGEAFVRSEGFKRIADPATRGQTFTTGAVEVGTFATKAGTVYESGQGAGLVPVPEVVPGVVETLFQPLAVADVIPSAQVATSSVRYINEGTATNAAAGVAEGGEKPASDLAYSTIDEPVKKIATVVTASDELLDDGSNVQQFINARLSLFVRLEEERQILRGAGTDELVGIFGRSINTYSRGTVDNNAVALAKVIANTRGSSFLEPDTIVLHPANWLATRLLTDTAAQFYGGGPFTGAYGNAGAPGLFGETLWGKRVVLSTYVGAGTALVGSFGQAAQLFRRGGVTVEASNSHLDYFTHNQVAIRAESRQALAVYRPQAFTAVSGLS